MSPSNIGDQMDYLPKDVLVDLSYTELNPIKSVYTNYTCDTGQRMWDTNCLVNAVLGDAQYNLSPRGWVSFVDRGEESLMLFKNDPNGNARYQIPGDSYFNLEKLMDIRRHTRINNHPAKYTIEAPQPQLTGKEALQWAQLRTNQLMDKYLGSAGNKLDPDNVRAMFRPLGYTGPNVFDYTEAENMLTDTIYTALLRKALKAGKRDVVIVTGAPACGKTTVVNQLNLKKAGVIYDAALIGEGRLTDAIAKAKREGMEKVKVVMVYNDVLTCYKNAVNRGKNTWRYVALDYLVNSFRDNVGKLEQVRKAYPDVEIVPIDLSGNQPLKQVSLDEAQKWNHSVSPDEIHSLLTYLSNEVNAGEIDAGSLLSATGNVLSIAGSRQDNIVLAKQIDEKVRELTQEYKVR